MNTRLASLGALVLLVVLFFALNLWAGKATRRARIDLTDQKLYTLSEGSKRIARTFDEPVKLTLYYSSKLAQGRPELQTYGTRVKEMLEEYASMSGGKIQLKIVNPEPSSEEEDAAEQAGLQGMPVTARESIYFGLVGTNAVDTKEVIPFFDPRKERFLEYDVSRLLYSLANPKKKTVGILSPLKVDGLGFDPTTGQPSRQQPWQITRELRANFQVKNLGAAVAEIPADVDVLLVLHPKGLSDSTLFAIDQYVLKGGRLVACVDPNCETDDTAADPRNPLAAMTAPKTSSLKKIFDAWGLEITDGKVVGDLTYALQVSMGNQGRPEPVTYVAWMDLTNRSPDGKPKDPFNHEDPVTSQLSRVIMATPGAIQLRTAAAKTEDNAAETKDGAKPEEPKADAPVAPPSVAITPLLKTSTQAMLIPQASVQFMPDPKTLLNSYAPGNTELTLAARVSLAPGAKLKTAFPDGKPTDPPMPGQPAPPPPADPKAGLVAEFAGPLNVIVIADADFANDRFWVQKDQFFGAMKIADNGDLLLNAIDNLAGSSDLISIRARGTFARPFDKVLAMQKSAEQNYRAEEKRLEDKIQQTQQKLSQLQTQKPTGEGAIILSPEQQAEIEKLRSEMGNTRVELRKVQFNLNKDVESLFNKLKFMNIGLIPIVVTLAAVALGLYRTARQRTTVETSSAQMPGATRAN